MNEQFRNKVCLIENGEQLQKAMDIIERNGGEVIEPLWFLVNDETDFLYCNHHSGFFALGVFIGFEKQITLSEFEELFNASN